MSLRLLFLFGLLFASMAGCNEPRPAWSPGQRPCELAELDAWRGGWISEFIVSGDPHAPVQRLEQSFEWVLDGAFLLETANGRINDQDYQQWVYNTWDANTGKYRYWMFDSFGSTGSGTRTFDKETRTWHSEYEMITAAGMVSAGAGRSTMLDDDHCEHHFLEWVPSRSQQKTRYQGFSRRVVQYPDE